jgi:hypothetical protein
MGKYVLNEGYLAPPRSSCSLGISPSSNSVPPVSNCRLHSKPWHPLCVAVPTSLYGELISSHSLAALRIRLT